MNHLAAEALDAAKLRRILVVAVVARAREQEAAAELDRLAGVGALDLHQPAGIRGRPLGGHDAMVEADPPVDAMLARCVADVVEDRGAIHDRARLGPGTERVAEREDVRIGTDAREAKQVPRPADRPARFEDRERLVGTSLLQPAPGPDAGDPAPTIRTSTFSRVMTGQLRRNGRTWRAYPEDGSVGERVTCVSDRLAARLLIRRPLPVLPMLESRPSRPRTRRPRSFRRPPLDAAYRADGPRPGAPRRSLARGRLRPRNG